MQSYYGSCDAGFFTHAHTPVGRGFDTSFSYMLGQQSHDNRSSQVSHTCGLPVKDLYNSTRIANETDGFAFNNVYSAEMYGSVAANIVRDHDASFPLFLYMAFLNCHAPNQAPQSYRDRFNDLPEGGSRRCYAGMMAAMDDAVGNITAALQSRPDMYQNSIVIFSTDNVGTYTCCPPCRRCHSCTPTFASVVC